MNPSSRTYRSPHVHYDRNPPFLERPARPDQKRNALCKPLSSHIFFFSYLASQRSLVRKEKNVTVRTLIFRKSKTDRRLRTVEGTKSLPPANTRNFARRTVSRSQCTSIPKKGPCDPTSISIINIPLAVKYI